jgi:hypothetical protein
MIRLDDDSIERALPRVAVGLEKYCWLRDAVHGRNVAADPEFQRRFNGFYRVRRNAAWRAAFFALLERQKTRHDPFASVLRELYDATGRIEASFVSKLTAPVDPDQPVIDAIVLQNLGLRLKATGSVEQRLAAIVGIHERIAALYAEYLAASGADLTRRFTACYPGRNLTSVKMLDLVLWQVRPDSHTLPARVAEED